MRKVILVNLANLVVWTGHILRCLYEICTYFRDDGYIAPFGPVGYGIGNFWGSIEDLEETVLRCSEVGVTVLANVVLNHFFFDFGDTRSSLGNRIHHPGKIFHSF